MELRVRFAPATGATAANGSQLDILFGSDEDVRQVSLTQLQQLDRDDDGVVDDARITFKLEGVEYRFLLKKVRIQLQRIESMLLIIVLKKLAKVKTTHLFIE